MKTFGKILIVLIAVVAAAYWYLTRPALGAILVFSKTAEYRHESIEAGIAALTEIAGDHRIEVVATEDPTQFNEDNLPQFAAVVFLNTTGMVLQKDQQEALQRYIQAGGGFMGIHAAADTHWKENDWPWYTRLLGAAFLSHPSDPSNVQAATISVEAPDHAATAMFESGFAFTDEWYDYQRVSERITVLLSIDESSYTGGRMGEEHPVAWFQEFDGGRSFYTNFGHRAETFDEPAVRQHLWAGLVYAMGDGQLDYERAAPESWRLKRVILDAGLDEPMAMDFTPGGDIYYIQRKGRLMRYDKATQASVEVTRFEVMDTGEYGLIGLAFDPNYADNRWLYIFRNTREGENGFYRLSRFKLQQGSLDLASEQHILSIPTEVGKQNHTGGSLVFGPAGNLWISTGDTTNPHESSGFNPTDDRPERQTYDASRTAGNTMDLRGKILRIRVAEDGSYRVPAGNLFDTGGRPEIFAMGLRNPFRFSVDQRTGTLYWGEVGPDSREYSESRGPWGYDEFNRTDTAGNFGWPFVIGNNEPYAYFDFDSELAGDFANPAAPENRSANNTGAGTLPPARAAWMPYPYELEERFIELGTGGRSAMAGPVYYAGDYPANPAKLPPYYNGKLFIYEWIRHWVQAVQMDASGDIVKIEPLMGVGSYSAPIDLKFAPDGALYVLEYGSAWFSQNDDAYLTRIEYYGDANPPPLVVTSADRRVGAAPLTTLLRGSKSYDRNGEFDSLEFSWDLVENGRVVAHIADTPDTEYVAEQAGDYQLRLTVTDADGVSSDSGVLLEVGNEPPAIELAFGNGNGSFFRDDGSVDYRILVTDAEDGSSADGGIDPRRVTVSVEYIPQGEDLANAQLGHQAASGIDGWAEIESSDCLSCHAREKESVGPSFTAVAERYAGQAGINEQLAEKILAGTSGEWGDYSMPPHPQMSAQQATAMASWIVDPDAPTATTAGLPLTGTIRFDQHGDDFIEAEMMGRLYTGRYLLMVSYTDGGAPGAHPQQASATHIWRPSIIDVTAADGLQAIMKMPVPMEEMRGFSVGIYRSTMSKAGWVMLKNIDLSGISTVRVGLATTSLFTTGGELALRRDGPDGPVIGHHLVENANLGMPENQDYYDFDVSELEARHTLYLISESEITEDRARPEFILGTLEFLP